MCTVDKAIANLRAIHERRSSAILIERVLIVLVLGVGLIMSIQYAHVTGATEHLLLNSALANAATPTPAYKFVEGKMVRY